jgi:hypothetical protein
MQMETDASTTRDVRGQAATEAAIADRGGHGEAFASNWDRRELRFAPR